MPQRQVPPLHLPGPGTVAQDGDSLDERLALLTTLGRDHNPEIRLSNVLVSEF